MDLLSTASAAAAITVSCVKLGTLLYCWIEEIRDVDGTLKIFMGEVNALSAVLDAVKSWSQDAVVTDSAQRQDSKVFWVIVQRTLEDCSTVIDQLGRLLADVQSKRRLGQLITNFLLNLKSGDIALIRQQIQSYTNVLQMAMQVMNVNMSIHNSVTSANASAALSSKMDLLLRYIKRAESSLSRQKSIRSSHQGAQEHKVDERGLERLEHCTKMAQSVFSSAATVIADTHSTRAGVRESYISIVGSEYAGISDFTRTGIEKWILEPVISEDVEQPTFPPSRGSASSLSPSTLQLSVASSRDILSETTLTIPSSDCHSQLEEAPTSDNNSNQDLELFWVFVRKGNEKYKSSKYADAERYYRKVLDRASRLQIAFDKNDVIAKLGVACFEQRKWDQAQSYFCMMPSGKDLLLERFILTGNGKLDRHDREGACAHFERALAMATELPLQTRRDIHSKAGIAYFQQEKWTHAKKHFLLVAGVEEDDMSDLRCFEAEHFLAKIHVQENDLDAAELRCLVASNGRRRILGKSHALWHESIALLVEIYTAKGDPVEADGYAMLLPEGYRSLHQREAKFSALCLKYGAQLSKMKDCLSPERRLGEVPLRDAFKEFDNAATALEAHLRASYFDNLQIHPYFKADASQLWGELLDDLIEGKPYHRSPLSERRLFTILHLLAILGLEAEAKIWLSISPPHAFLKDGRDNTPFQLAVSAGHANLASFFLDIPEFRIEAAGLAPESLLNSSLAASSMEPLSFLISQDLIDPTSRYGSQHETPLMVACRKSHVPAARFLVSRSNLTVNERNDVGETALMIAASHGYLEVVELLLSQDNIDVNARSANTASALSMSVKGGHEKVVDVLLDEPTLDQEHLGKALIASTEANWTTVMRKIVKTGRIAASSGNAALLIAATRGEGDTIEALLGFDVNMTDEKGERLLNGTIRRGAVGVVQALVKAEALDINHNPGPSETGPPTGTPALHLAAKLGLTEILKLLLGNPRLDVNLIDATGLSAMHLAIFHSQLPAIETLLSSPTININLATRNFFKTPLHLAVKTRSPEIVRLLLAVRPDLQPNKLDTSNRTPLMMTAEPKFHHPQIVWTLLSDSRVDPDFANAQGDTALHHAAMHANLDIVQALLQCPRIRRTDVKNRAGLTAKKVAERGAKAAAGPKDAEAFKAVAKALSKFGTSKELRQWF